MLKFLSTTLIGFAFLLSMLYPTNLLSQEGESPTNDTTLLEETIPLSGPVDSAQAEVETTVNTDEESGHATLTDKEQSEPLKEAEKAAVGGIDSLINVYMDPVTAAVSKVIFFQVAIIPSHSIYKVKEGTYVSADIKSDYESE